jgi:hypothetical protein
MRKSERAELLAGFKSSGLSAAEYARRRGLRVEALYRWQAEARRPAGGFSRVQTGVVVEVQASGVLIKVPLESLHAVIKELSHEA